MTEAPRWLTLLVNLVVNLSLLAVAGSVWLDFKLYGHRSNTRAARHSLVATGTMTLFFLLYYLVLRLRWGAGYPPAGLRYAMIAMGLVLVAGGAVMNMHGRMVLGRNWANHIKIYGDHTLITAGPFRWVRHPLYASLFAMFYGGCLIYANWFGAVLTSVIFVPMMNYRAAQEETLLRKTFPEYDDYTRAAGRFCPKRLRGYQKACK